MPRPTELNDLGSNAVLGMAQPKEMNMQGYDQRLYKMASEKGWKLPANSALPAHSWNHYWAQCEEYERNPEAGRPVVPHRSA